MSKLVKLAIWHAIIASVAFGLWLDVSKWFEALRLEKGFTSYAVVTFVFLAALVMIGFALFRDRWLVLSLSGIIGLAYLINFGVSELNFVGVGVMFLLLLQSRSDVIAEVTERTKVNSRTIVRGGIMPFMFGLFILVSFASYQSPAFGKFDKIERLPSESEKYIKVIAENTIGRKIEGSEQEKEAVINQITAEVMREFNTVLGPYFKYAPPVLAFTLFLILWSISWIFIWLSVLAGMMIFFILKKIGFVKIEEKDVKAEILVI